MSEITNLPLGDVIRYAEFGRSQMMAQMQAQVNYQNQQSGVQNTLTSFGLGFLNTPAQPFYGAQQAAKRSRRTTDAELDKRFKQLTIDLEARRI